MKSDDKVDGGLRTPSDRMPENASGGRVPPLDDAVTGLPGLRTWPAVYVFVLGVFVLWVGLLTVLTEMYS